MKIFPDYEDASLTPEELAEATQNMEQALLPRDKDGYVYPILPDSPGSLADAIGEMQCPVIQPDANGCTPPIIQAKDFAHGKIPDYLGYAPGWMKPGSRPYDCTSLDVFLFKDPVLNLSPRDQYLLQQAQNAPPPPQQPTHQDSALPSGITPPRRVWATPQGMALEAAEGGEFLSNFQVRAIQRRLIVTRGEPDREAFTLEVTRGNESRRLTVSPTDLENLAPVIARKFPACYTEADASKASQRIANVIRSQIPSLPTVTVIRSPGFVKLGDQWVYAHDAARCKGPVEFQTGYTIPCDPALSRLDALRALLGLLELTANTPTMLPLLLESHLGPLFNLFEAAGVAPKFVLFLHGETGSLKTAVAQALFRLFEELPRNPEATFRDTKTALEVKIGSACSRVLVVDDFQPAVTATAGRENLEKLEHIIRFFGDGIAKSRSNSELGRAKEFHPAGCCIVTGEDTGGSHSSLLRCLVLPVSKGEIDGNKLRFYQDDPQVLQTHFFHFLEWAGEYGDEIVDFIRREFQHEREIFAGIVAEPRQADIGATLLLTAQILLAYIHAEMSLEESEMRAIEQRWGDTLVELLRRSEDESKEVDPALMYVKALLESHAAGKFTIAPTQSAYKPGYHIGFTKDDCWWLLPKEAYTHVLRYWRDEGTLFPLKVEKVHSLLYKAQLIEVSKENRKGREKTLYTKKSTLEGRPRMLVLRVEQARDYVEQLR